MEEVGDPVYLAYGSNMDIEQMRARCPDTARRSGWLIPSPLPETLGT